MLNPGLHCKYIPQDPGKTLSTLYTPQIPEPEETRQPNQPERNLCAAIIARAIEDGFGYAHKERHLIRDSRAWLEDNDEKTPFTFAWCCIILDIEPEEVREKLCSLEYRFEIPKRFRRTH